LKINKIAVLFSVFLTCTFFSCQEKIQNDSQKNIKMVGCWKGGLVKNKAIAETDLQLRLLSLRPDGSLALTTIYELGPRCRVWTYDLDVTYQNNNISWLAHQGYVSENGETMQITKNWKGEESHWMFFRDHSSDSLMNHLMSSESTEYPYKIPDGTSDGWICTDMRDVGIDEAKITRLINHIKKGKHGDIHSILICRNGKLVLEEYFALNGKLSGSFVTDVFRDRVHHLASVTKAVTSALIGITIDRGLIENVERPLFSFFPEYAYLNTNDKNRIDLRHMLTMTAGLEWEQFRYPFSDRRNDGGEMYRTEVLAKTVASKPGVKFRYSNGLPTVIGVVIEKASGIEVDKFVEENLFNTLGISEYLWTRYPDGSIETDGGLALRSRDLAKIGQLFLNKGKWAGQQMISESWIRESTIRRVGLTRNRGYGYYWNEMKLNVEGNMEKAIFAPGDGGQFIAVFPTMDMVVVITAGNYDMDPTSTYWSLIKNNILPALTYMDLQN